MSPEGERLARILPRYNRTTLAAEDARKINKIIGEASTNDTNTDTKHARATAPGDTRRLRGIPVAGGACGTSPGTDPLAALIRNDNR